MFNPERTCCWRNSRQYIRREFELEYPDGELGHMDNGDFTGYKTAKAIPIVEDWNK